MRLSDDLLANQPVLDALAKAAGIGSNKAKAVVAAVLAELAASTERNTLSRGGLADFVAFMGRGAPDRLIDEPGWINDPARSNRVEDYGIAALNLFFGSKDKSRAVADRVARSTGVDAAIVRDLLPSIAAVAVGGVRRETASAFGDIFKRHPDIPGSDQRGSTGGFGDRSMPPSGGDIPEQSPLPLPGELPRGGYDGGGYRRGGGATRGGYQPDRDASSEQRTPYDDLSDILRRGGFGGGRQGGGQPGGGQPGGGTTINIPGGGTGGSLLWSIVREVIGAVMGFQSRGIVGWIIRAVVLRYGWQIVQSVLRRVLTGRR